MSHFFSSEQPTPDTDFGDVLNFDLQPTDAQSIVESLRPAELTPTELCNLADHLIETYGEVTTVNGIASKATRKYWRVDQEHGSFYARIGSPLVHTDDSTLASFILTTTPDFDSIETPNGKFSEFFFRYTDGAGTQLLNGPDAPTPNGYVSNRPGHTKLAAEILENLKEQYTQDPTYHKATVSPDAGNELPTQWANQAWDKTVARHNNPSKFSVKKALMVGGLTVAVSVTGISIGQSYAKQRPLITSQPVAPEAHSQLCNNNGLCVDAPVSSLKTIPLAPGVTINRLPVNTPYKTAMDQLADKGEEVVNSDAILRTDQGIFSYDYPTATVKTDEGNCAYIEGNFNQGISTAFTTSTTISESIKLKVLTTSTLEVCKTSTATQSKGGSFYIVRGTP